LFSLPFTVCHCYKKEIDAKVAPHTNPAMPMKMPFGSSGFQEINWQVPNIISGNMPGFDNMATSLMKETFKKKGVATVEQLREMCQESGVRFIACQMTMEVSVSRRRSLLTASSTAVRQHFLSMRPMPTSHCLCDAPKSQPYAYRS